jgi:hypothetical protein
MASTNMAATCHCYGVESIASPIICTHRFFDGIPWFASQNWCEIATDFGVQPKNANLCKKPIAKVCIAAIHHLDRPGSKGLISFFGRVE